MTDQWVPGPPPVPTPPIQPMPPANSWNTVAPCSTGDSPSYVDGVIITGVPAVVSAMPWQITLNDGASPANFTIDHYDASGALIDHPMEVSGVDGTVTFNDPVMLSRDPVAPMEAVTLEYLEAHGAGVEEAPSDGTTYARNNAAWTHLTHTDITDWATAVPPPYVLPTASTTVLGGVMVDGATITISGGVISGTPQSGPPVAISDTAPASPAAGDLWWDSVGGQLYVWYDDGNSSQWVPASNAGALPDASTSPPLMDGTASAGTAAAWSRGDHVHPSDTTRAPLASPTFTGTVTIPAGASISGYMPTSGGTFTGSVVVAAGLNFTSYGTSYFGSSGQLSIANNGNLSTSGQIVSGSVLYPSNSVATDYYIQATGNTRAIAFRAGVYNLQLDNSTGNLIWYGNSAVAFQCDYTGSMTLSNNITVAGNGFKPGGGSWAASSDIRVKRNVTSYAKGLREVMKLKPIEFEYNGEGGTIADGKRYVGFAAHEAREAMPEMVFEQPGPASENNDPSLDKRLEGQLATDVSPLIYALVNAVKTLKAEIDALKAAR